MLYLVHVEGNSIIDLYVQGIERWVTLKVQLVRLHWIVIVNLCQ